MTDSSNLTRFPDHAIEQYDGTLMPVRGSITWSRVSMRLSVRPLVAAFTTFCLALAGCTMPPPVNDPDAVAEYNETNDPLEPTNRVFYAVNDALDTVILRPIALGYRAVLPSPVRTGVHNVLNNLGTPVTLANDLMQGNTRRAGDTMSRFLLNTTLGVGGLIDVATERGILDHPADFGMTLAVWGVGDGVFLFLPVLGPTGPRDAAGFSVDSFVLDPWGWVGKGNTVRNLRIARTGLSAVDARVAVLDDFDKVKAQALDPYATIRSLYRQYRTKQIDDARGDVTPQAVKKSP
ncbi:MAG: VacJ family lipoprotein [Alphaproteobacteria bacterium]|nr:VacJ family lipoprotein [Alphaproteobacteria bacterium]